MTNNQNWATNVQFQTNQYRQPETIEELQEVVRTATKVRVVGSGHSFNDIADTTGTLISLDKLDNTVTFDHTNHRATVPAGMTHIELAPILHQAGYAMPNMASLPHITVIGACTTATHGSGDSHGNLATQVSALEIVNDEGELRQLSRTQHGERFNGMVVSLGALGVVTKVTLDLVPAYTMYQHVYRGLALSEMEAHFDEIMGCGYSVSLFTPWQNKTVDQVWVKQKMTDIQTEGQAVAVEPTLFGATLAETDMHPVEGGGFTTDILTRQMGVPRVWHDILPHFNLQCVITGADERQTEYFVARENAVEAILAAESLHATFASLIKLSEVRTVAADNLWLSPAYEQDCIGLHFSWYGRDDEIWQFLPLLEEKLAPFQPRPHWAKMFTIEPEVVSALYPKMSAFRALLDEFDPNQKFRNRYVARYTQS